MSTSRAIQSPGGTMHFGNLQRVGPKSNAQRQREFRARNPGYYRKYNARAKAQRKAAKAACEARHRAMSEARTAPLFAEVILAPHLPRPVPTPTAITPTAVEPALPLFDGLDDHDGGFTVHLRAA